MGVKRRMAMALVAAGALVPAGCTNSDDLTRANATLEVRLVIAGAPNRFEEAFFFVRQIFVVPTDPLSSDALNEPFSLINPRDTIEVNANQSGLQFTVPVNLGTGPWQVTAMRLDSFVYQDFDAPTPGAECDDYISVYRTGNTVVDLIDLGPIAPFTIEPGVTNQLTITIDHEVFLSAFQDSFFCVPFGSLGCANDWCLIPPADPNNPFFVPVPLFLQAPQYLTFE